MRKIMSILLVSMLLTMMCRITHCGGIQYFLTEEEEAEFEQFVPDVIKYYEEKYEIDDVSVEHYSYLSPSRDLFGGIVQSDDRYYEMNDGFYVVWINSEGQYYDNRQADEIATGLMDDLILPKIEEFEEKYDIEITTEKTYMNHLAYHPHIDVFHNKYCQDAESFVNSENVNLEMKNVMFMGSPTKDFKTPMVEMGEFLDNNFNVNVVEMHGCTPEFAKRFTKSCYHDNYLFDKSVDAFCSYTLSFEDEDGWSIEKSGNNHWHSYFGSYDEYSLKSYWNEKKYYELLPSLDITPRYYKSITLEEGDITFEEVLSQDELEEILLKYQLNEDSDGSDTAADPVTLQKIPITPGYKITFSDKFKEDNFDTNHKSLSCYLKFHPTPEKDKYSQYEVYELVEEDGKIVVSNTYALHSSSIEHTYGCDRELYTADCDMYFICATSDKNDE